MSTSPLNGFYRPKLCWKHATHPKYCFRGSFVGLAKPLRRNSENSHKFTLRHIDSRLLFQTWSKSAQHKCPKGRVVLVTEKKQNTFWRRLAEPLGRFSPILCECALRTTCTHASDSFSWFLALHKFACTYSRFHQNPFRFRGVITGVITEVEL